MTRIAPRTLAISDRRSLAVQALEAWLRDLSERRVDAVELREKDLSDRELLELAREARRHLGKETLLLINGRADIALASGAQGVHLPSNAAPLAAVRRRFGPQLVIGCSTHHPAEVERARRDGADYVTFGPVFFTPSKAAYGPPPGLEGLRRAAATGLPVLALGGVGADQMEAAAAVGAAGIAGIRAFQRPAEVDRMVATSRRLWPRKAAE